MLQCVFVTVFSIFYCVSLPHRPRCVFIPAFSPGICYPKIFQEYFIPAFSRNIYPRIFQEYFIPGFLRNILSQHFPGIFYPRIFQEYFTPGFSRNILPQNFPGRVEATPSSQPRNTTQKHSKCLSSYTITSLSLDNWRHQRIYTHFMNMGARVS